MSKGNLSLDGFKKINSNQKLYAFNQVWVREIAEAIDTGLSVHLVEEQTYGNLPALGVYDACIKIREVLDRYFSANLTNDLGEIVVCIGEGANKEANLCLFQSVTSKVGTPYSKKLFDCFSLSEKEYLAYRGSLKTFAPSFGELKLNTRGAKRVVICTPVYRRLALLDLFMEYMCNFYMPALEWAGYEVIFAVAGQSEESPIVRKYLRKGLLFFELENNLGLKKNFLLRVAKDIQADYLTYIDSDDFIHPKLTEDMIKVADANSYWSAIEPFCFFDAKTKKYGLFEGYPKPKELHGWGMGSGRVFTTKLLKVLGSDPFAHKNKSLDWYIREQLSKVDVPIEDRLVRLDEVSYLPLGLKTEENIWAYDSYPLKELDSKDSLVDWLPVKIKESYLSIGFSQS